jgi:hypothetical protein
MFEHHGSHTPYKALEQTWQLEQEWGEQEEGTGLESRVTKRIRQLADGPGDIRRPVDVDEVRRESRSMHLTGQSRTTLRDRWTCT